MRKLKGNIGRGQFTDDDEGNLVDYLNEADVNRELSKAIQTYRTEVNRLIRVLSGFDKKDIAQCNDALDKLENELFPVIFN